MSHIIVIATLMLPGMILAEMALSWLGLGIRPPMASWGVLLQEGGRIRRHPLHAVAAVPDPLCNVFHHGFQLAG